MSKPIALGLTLLEQVDAMVALRWIELLRTPPAWLGPVYNGRGQYTVQARNIVLEQAFTEPDKWPGGLFFWDSDQLPPMRVPGPLATDPSWRGGSFTDYVSHVSEALPTTTVGGLYFSRISQFEYDAYGKLTSLPHEAVAYHRNDDGTYRNLNLEELGPMLTARGRYPCDGVGTGCMLIPQATLMALKELKHPQAIFEAPTLRAGEHGGLGGRQWTEDLYFCHEITTRLPAPLNQVYVDTAMESAHLAKIPISTQHHLAARGVFSHRNPVLDAKQQGPQAQAIIPLKSKIVLARPSDIP